MTGHAVAIRIATTPGTLHVLERDGRLTGLLFSDREGAARFAAILGAVEEVPYTVRSLDEDGLQAVLDELSWRSEDVLIDPEFVARVGPVAERASAYATRAVLRRAAYVA